jgi:hypothetical protein
MKIEDRVERLNSFIHEDRIIRSHWTGTDEQGRETACLLAALSPEVGKAEGEWACPADVMPAWMAHLTPWMDDNSSEEEWSRMVRRYAACAARWSSLDDAAWRRVDIVSRRASMVEAMNHATDEKVLGVCRGVLEWLDSDMPEQSREALRVAAEAAVPKAMRVTDVWVAKCAARVATTWAARVATGARVATAWGAAAEVVRVTTRAQRAAAADRIIDAVLTALEKECGL